MAELEQEVLWSLGFDCALRARAESKQPSRVQDSLRRPIHFERSLRSASRHGEVIDDVVVTDCRSIAEVLRNPSHGELLYPEKGWLVSQRFGEFGGVEKMGQMCGTCPANPSSHSLAGCSGRFYLAPDSGALNELLVTTIGRSGRQLDYENEFTLTTPLWYGLWIGGRISGEGLELLACLLEEMINAGGFEISSAERGGLMTFGRAVQHAIQNDLEVHVELSPPRRHDLDVVQVLAHCPRCRARASDQPTIHKMPTALQSCFVCGIRFSPAESVGAFRQSTLGDSLYRQLGHDAYGQWLGRYFARRELVGDEATLLVDELLAVAARELAFEDQLVELRSRQRQFLEEQIYVGMAEVPSPCCMTGELEEGEGIETQRWFLADEFETILRRAVKRGVLVRYLTHMGKSKASERHAWEELENPFSVFEKWREQGCDEKFSALLIVPKELVAAK